MYTTLPLPSNRRYALGGLLNPDCGVEQRSETEKGRLMAADNGVSASVEQHVETCWSETCRNADCPGGGAQICARADRPSQDSSRLENGTQCLGGWWECDRGAAQDYPRLRSFADIVSVSILLLFYEDR